MKKSVWVVFAVFCAFASSEWLLPPISGETRALVYAATGLIAMAVNGGKIWPPRRETFRLAGASVLTVGVPALISRCATVHLSSVSETVVMAFVPMLVVLVIAQSDSENARSSLVPAIFGLSGILLLVPFSVPESVAGRASLAALATGAVLAAIGNVMVHRCLKEVSLVQGIAIFCVSNALVLLGQVRSSLEWGWISAALLSAELVLLVGLLKGIPPIRLASRYLIVPGITIVEGFALLRPGLTVRLIAGVALLAAGVSWMLMSPRDDERITLSLR